MSNILDIQDLPPLELPEDGEHQITILKMSIRDWENEKGSGSFLSLFCTCADVDTEPFSAMVSIPNTNQDEAQQKRAMRDLSTFQKAAKLPSDFLRKIERVGADKQVVTEAEADYAGTTVYGVTKRGTNKKTGEEEVSRVRWLVK